MSEVEYAPTLAQKIAAEVLGTFVLVLLGVGTAVVTSTGEDPGGYVATGLAFGIAVLVMAYAVGHVSGGHFNPAVSVGAAIAGRISWAHAGIYAVAQVVGAVVAAFVLFLAMSGFEGFEAEGNMGANAFGDQTPGDYAWWAAFLVELVATLVFLYVILAATDARNPAKAAAPVAIGLGLAGIHFATMAYTGTSVNPARSIGPALFNGVDSIAQLWLFILAPLLGALLAGLTYPLVWGRDTEPVAGSGLAAFGARQPGAYQGQQAWAQQVGWGQDQQGWGTGQQGWGQPVAGQQASAQQAWGDQAQAGQYAAQQPVQQQYPGWQWDPATQQWVPDQSQQQPPQQQWGDAASGEGSVEDGPRTQIRPPQDNA